MSVKIFSTLSATAAVLVATALPAAACPPTGPTLRSLARHDRIHVGSAISAGYLSDPAYAAIAGGQFDAVTPENEMKWSSVEPVEGVFDWSGADRIVAFAHAHHQLIRGHNLVWHNQIPGWLSTGGFTPAQLAALLKQHILDEAGRYKGQIYAWDVVNEPFNEDGSLRQDIWSDALGPDYIADALTWAHQADPKAKLYLNDYNVEGVNAKSDAMYQLVKSLKARGVPIDGVGLQSHMIVGENPPDIAANMARFTALGVDVAVTELDDRMPLPATPAALAQQATDYRNVVNDCLSVRGCVGVTVWEFDDGHSWVPSFFPGVGAALPYDSAYQPKPAYYAMQAALAAGRH